MTNTSPRRWYQFSLRTFLVVMAIVSAVFGYWVHWSREWIRQRQEFRTAHPFASCGDILELPPPTASASLWLFGETGEAMMNLGIERPPREVEEEARKLFPEAQITNGIVLPKGVSPF